MVPGSSLVREKVLPDRDTLIRNTFEVRVAPLQVNSCISLRSRTATLELSAAGANGLATGQPVENPRK
mgnify:CR=1 FL=1